MAGNILHLRTRVAAAKAQLTDATVCLWIHGNQNISKHHQTFIFFASPLFSTSIALFLFFWRGCCTWCTVPTWASQNPTCRCFSNGNIVGVEKVWRRRSVNFQRWTCPSFHDRRHWHRKTWWVEVELLGWVGYVGFLRWVGVLKLVFLVNPLEEVTPWKLDKRILEIRKSISFWTCFPRNSWSFTRIL